MLIYVDEFYRLLLQPILCNPMQLTECTTGLKQWGPDALRTSVKNVVTLLVKSQTCRKAV